jgi:hypothetical protein
VTELTPLEPREFFDRPWSGEGEFVPRRWLRWLPMPRRMRFRSHSTWLRPDLWITHDETVWDDGRVERRDGIAKLLADDRIRFTYSDMPGGTELRLHARGWEFAPYVMVVRAVWLPIAVLVRCRDRCRLDDDGTLVDEIDISLARIPLGRQVMRLRPERPPAGEEVSTPAGTHAHVA